jgi:ATP-dependent Clp protease protease subunit
MKTVSKGALPFPLAALMAAKGNDEYINSIEKTVHHHDVFLDGDILEPSNYRELLALLFNAGEEDTVNIFINSGGGHLDTALAVVEGLKATRANVTAVLIGACHSAASIISMYCHEVAVLDNAYSMVHTASFGAMGNTGNVKSHTEFTVKQVEKLLNDTYEGFLTKEELSKVKSGVELWFDSDEIRTRMESRVKLLISRAKKALKGVSNE